MKKSAVIWLCIAGALVIAGVAGIVTAVVLQGGLGQIIKNETEVKTYIISDSINSISIDVSTQDITFVKSENGESRVVSEYKKGYELEIKEENGTLKIEYPGNQKWHEKISLFSFGKNRITVYLGKSQYSDIDIECSTGDVNINSVNCDDLEIKLSTGDITLKNVVATAEFDIKSSTGDVRFDGCDAGDISVKTSTGDVTGTLLTDKIFSAKTSTGDINVPKSKTGGKCEINTSTGDIFIEIKK